jgi:hypothetical protein
MVMMWRHGDVMIATVDSLPATAKLRPDVILARGEITGHMHRVESASTAELWELDGQVYIKVVADTARIVHEEHKPVTLPRGLYRVWQQREYTPQKVRPVYD